MTTQRMRNPTGRTTLLLTAAAAILLTSACSMRPLKDPSTKPVNCATAEGDLRALNSEKKYAQSQELISATAITPAGALLGIATDTENEKLEILSGDYRKKLDTRIAEIKAKCNL
ncbi:hypothetical protein M3P21_09900 [Ruegeria sp. 2012CJ41-6]|uniref:Lipoprotein n=1 Tax=Ruegeria spongiae TaxID=2942209 RepID=A0ABT0Q1T6_9RHOB|nr:hypothetical protein [Ruegeria spongiae]MCL6283841.1 hypothetical protein [Ruegeria spongiae]